MSTKSIPPQTIGDLSAKQKVIVFVLMVASMTNCMGAAAVAPALPSMSAAFPQVSATVIAWVITMPNLAMTIFAFLSGAIADKIGKKVTLVASSVIFTASGLAAIGMNAIEPILACRFILGIGIAGLGVSTTALISELFHGHLRASVISLQAAFAGLGVCLLETTGGFLAGLGWRMPFLVYLVGFIIFFGAVFFLRRSVMEELRGLGGEDEPAAPNKDVVIPKKEVVTTVVGACFFIFVMQLGMFSYPGRIPYLIEEMGCPTYVGGLILGLNGLATLVFSLWQGRAVRRMPRWALLTLAAAMISVGLIGFYFAKNIIAVAIIAIFGGGGQGIFMATEVQWISTAATPKTSGKVMGAYTMFFNLACFIASFIIEPLRIATGSLQGMFLVLGLMMAVETVIIFAVGRKIIK